jgi:hypothetical protein
MLQAYFLLPTWFLFLAEKWGQSKSITYQKVDDKCSDALENQGNRPTLPARAVSKLQCSSGALCFHFILIFQILCGKAGQQSRPAPIEDSFQCIMVEEKGCVFDILLWTLCSSLFFFLFFFQDTCLLHQNLSKNGVPNRRFLWTRLTFPWKKRGRRLVLPPAKIPLQEKSVQLNPQSDWKV